jgi:hypothetical protein
LLAIGRLPVGPHSAGADELLLASAFDASVGPFGLQSLVQLKLDELGESFGRTQIAGVGLLAGMQTQVLLEMGLLAEPLRANVALVRFLPSVDQVVLLEIGLVTEPCLADVALVRFLPSVDQVVLLEVGQLGEPLLADVALEGALAGMRSQVSFQVAQLTERLLANVALVVQFAALFLQRVRQRSASGRGVAVQGLAVVGTELLLLLLVADQFGRANKVFLYKCKVNCMKIYNCVGWMEKYQKRSMR